MTYITGTGSDRVGTVILTV